MNYKSADTVGSIAYQERKKGYMQPKPDVITDLNNTLLIMTLQAAVPSSIERMRQAARPRDTDWEWLAAQTDILASGGDVVLYKGATKGKSKGETARTMNTLIRALTIAAFAPGGVTFAGLHFEGKHRGHQKEATQ